MIPLFITAAEHWVDLTEIDPHLMHLKEGVFFMHITVNGCIIQ